MPDAPLPPFLAPDLASLRYPWSDPIVPPPAPIDPYAAPPIPAPAPPQPGIGIPAAALDAAIPPAPVLGPPPEGAPPYQPPPAELAPPPYSPPGPAKVADFPGLTITTEPPPGAPPAPGTLPPGTAGPPLSPEEQQYRQVVDQHKGDPLGIPDEAMRQRRLAELNPYELGETNLRDKERRDAFVAQRRREYVELDTAAARQHLEDWKAADAATQAKLDTVQADADRLAATKIDPSGGVHGGRLLAGVVASIIGGLVQGRAGGRNVGLDALQGAIDRGIDAQKTELANKRGAIDLKRNVLAAEFARHGDLYQAEEAVRRAAWMHTDDLLAFEQQSYDPRGRTALAIANQRAQIRAAIAQSAEAARTKVFENELKSREQARKELETVSTIQHQRAQTDLGYAQLASAAADRKEARDARAADKAAERADKEAERDRQFAIGGVPHVQVGADGKPVLGPDGKPVIAHDDLRNADGTKWRAPSPEAEKSLREKKTSATQMVKLYDRALAIRDRVGGESSVFNSDEYQELDAIGKELVGLKKLGTQGMSSDADMENLATAAAAKDITSFRSKTAGLKAARARTIDNLNQSFADAKYTGPRIDFPEPERAKNTPDEDRKQALIQKPDDLSLDAAVKREIDARTAKRGYSQLDLNDPADRALYDEAVAAGRKAASATEEGASLDQRANIDALAGAAAGAGEGATAARQTLQKIATSADTAKLRQLAQESLDAIERSKRPAPRGPTSTPLDIPEELKLGVGVR